MSAITLLMAWSSLGISAGWEPLPEGGLQYTIQVEPQQLKSLAPGEELVSEVPPKYRDIRRIRVVVGQEKLVRVEPSVTGPASPTEIGPSKSAVAAKSDVKPASATEAVVGPTFPGEPAPEGTGAKETAAQETPTKETVAKAIVPPVTEKTKPEEAKSASSENANEEGGQKYVAGYGKTEGTIPTVGEESASWPWIAIMLGLFASLGANVFLAWTAWGAYGRYRSLVRRMNAT